ncbi:hypothetical protein ACA910_016974 [Epithemia clementina (nom. ined.)]
MSLSSALNNVFSLERQRARYGSERVQAVEDGTRASNEAPANNSERDLESGEPDSPRALQSQNSVDASNSTPLNRTGRRERESADDVGEATSEVDGSRVRSPVALVSGEPAEAESTEDEFTARSHFTRSNTMTLAELEEQRELSRRRSSACVLLAVFVLFRLWIECLQKREPTLLLLCLLGTSWTARWIRFNREREEELDRRIEAYLQNNNNNTEVDRNEFARLSFQAQLALAIMESQRHMMEGGFGRPDGSDDLEATGVSEEAKAKWKRFQWKSPSGNGGTLSKKGDYGAVPTKGNVGDMDNHCSICLSEYDDSEMLTQLPCNHVYHGECIQAWTQNHVKCPLCNFDLEEAKSAASVSVSNSVDSGDSIV